MSIHVVLNSCVKCPKCKGEVRLQVSECEAFFICQGCKKEYDFLSKEMVRAIEKVMDGEG